MSQTSRSRAVEPAGGVRGWRLLERHALLALAVSIGAGCGATAGGGDPPAGCVPETDAAFCVALGKNCGSVSGTDNCGTPRSADCGESCPSGQTCGGAGVANVCAPSGGGTCVPQTDSQFCAAAGKNCGTFSGTDNCAASRSAGCGTCPSNETCGGEGATNVCVPAGGGACTPETDAQFCAGLGMNCGSVSNTDNCGAARTASCGTCTGGEVCGSGAAANVCCTPETDAAFCASGALDCGTVTWTDNCGAPRSTNCGGSCPAGQSCGGGGVANVCACVPETDAAFCASGGLDCGTVTWTDNCGTPRSTNCGGTCPAGESCGGIGTPNVCGTCTPETDPAFCAAAGKSCGSYSATDNCGAPRTASCGTCPSGETCGGGGPNVCGARESWIAVYIDYPTALADIAANPQSFTHVVPTFYTVNYNYQSGVAYYSTCGDGGNPVCTANTANAFPDVDGSNVLTTEQFTKQATALGLRTVPIIYGGAANQGTDIGIENILTNATTQDLFINAMASEAVTNGYAGYNIDWEVAGGGAVNASQAQNFVTFVNNFRAALVNAGIANPILSVSAIVSNINGTNCSGNNGYLDFSLLQSSSVDRIVIEDFLGTLSSASPATTTCQDVVLSSSSPVNCDYTVTGLLNMMCPPNLGSTAALDFEKAVIGLEADPYGTNPIIGSAFSTIESYGFQKVAVWPQYQSTADPFMSNAKNSPATDTWYALLAAFLAQ